LNLQDNLKNIEKQISSVTSDYRFQNKMLQQKTKEASQIPDNIVCEFCSKVVSDSDELRKKAAEEIYSLEVTVQGLVEKGKTLRDQQKKIESQLLEEKNALKKQLDQLSKSITEKETELRAEIQKEIYRLMTLKDLNQTRQRNIADLIRATKDLEVCEKNIELFHKMKDTIAFNKKIQFNITELKESKQLLDTEKYSLENEIGSIRGQISFAKSSIQDKENTLEVIVKEVQKDKIHQIYQELHGTDGLAKHIILSVLPKINDDLEELISDLCDFRLFIDFNDKGIEFMVGKDNVEYELYMCSGLEKTISSLALHYVNMKISTLPTPNILILDEIFSGVSNENMENVLPVIEKLLEVFSNIDLITHREIVSKWAENIITIKKDKNNISSINLIKNNKI
jgi:DNA repair exonuclease SbcCD ATPase subunit